MSKCIAFVTTARSEYGACYWLISALIRDPGVELALVVGGSHLSARHGYTVVEIERDGWPIAARVPFLDEDEEETRLETGGARALAGFAELFARLRPEMVVVAGDRWELLPIATAAFLNRIPLAHLYGGDITEGAIDDQVRHAVTKLAHLHFPSSAASAQRIAQMGEEVWRIHQLGDPALDHLALSDAASLEELTQLLGFVPDRNTILLTFHPPTMELDQLDRQLEELLSALEDFDGKIVFTGPAPDPGCGQIREAFGAFARNQPARRVYVEHLGSRRYRGLLRLVGAMVGNSSSGVLEAPQFGLPVLNLGSRQQGRDRSRNVIDVNFGVNRIGAELRRALSPEFRQAAAAVVEAGVRPASARIAEVLRLAPDRETLLRKRFVCTHG